MAAFLASKRGAATPVLAASRAILGARRTNIRCDPPPNQWGDILPTVWSDDGSTYALMDDGPGCGRAARSS
jgi:hypothetical protein